jgi:hypothetical protein
MKIVVDVLELASELAHIELVENFSESIKIFEDENAGVTHYTEEAQDIFNDLYDKYFHLIESFKE